MLESAPNNVECCRCFSMRDFDTRRYCRTKPLTICGETLLCKLCFAPWGFEGRRANFQHHKLPLNFPGLLSRIVPCFMRLARTAPAAGAFPSDRASSHESRREARIHWPPMRLGNAPPPRPSILWRTRPHLVAIWHIPAVALASRLQPGLLLALKRSAAPRVHALLLHPAVHSLHNILKALSYPHSFTAFRLHSIRIPYNTHQLFPSLPNDTTIHQINQDAFHPDSLRWRCLHYRCCGPRDQRIPQDRRGWQDIHRQVLAC